MEAARRPWRWAQQFKDIQTCREILEVESKHNRRSYSVKLLSTPLLLELLTTGMDIGIISNMKAFELIRTRIAYSESAFAELVLWRIPKPMEGSLHRFKYRLAYVVRGECVLRYDNEVGKGDHRHFGGKESACMFTTPEQLVADFQNDIARWNHENLNA